MIKIFDTEHMIATVEKINKNGNLRHIIKSTGTKSLVFIYLYILYVGEEDGELKNRYLSEEEVKNLFYFDEICKDVITNPAYDNGQNAPLLCLADRLEEEAMDIRKDNSAQILWCLDFMTDYIMNNLDLLAGCEDRDEALGRIARIKKDLEYNVMEEPELRRPSEIKAYLDQYVIGQEMAKKTISTAIYGHLKRIAHPESSFPSNVVLLIGPSGCGKTEIMRCIQRITNLPMVFTDVSSLGASQYAGRHKEDLLLGLLEKAGNNIELAECGIVFMDELDKLLIPTYSNRGINVHDDVQSQLLTMLEGADVEIKRDNKVFHMDTRKILFVLAGAFQGIEEVICRIHRVQETGAGSIGFQSSLDQEIKQSLLQDKINHEVLIGYGMKTELAGRISSIAVLEKMTEETVLRILTEPKDSILQRYERELALMCGAKLEIEPEAKRRLAKEVMEQKVGARAIYMVLYRVMKDILYKAPGLKNVKKVQITEDSILHGSEPRILYK